MKEVNYRDYVNKALENIGKGVFLTLQDKDQLNTMTIGWGSFGIIWGKPIFTVMVRKSRYTYQLINNNDEFTVSFPAENELKKELAFCGSKSGRDFDKFKECNLTPIESIKLNTPIIGEAKLHFECKIKYKQDMEGMNLDKSYDDRWYPDKDYHTLYYGEIVSCYLNE